MSEYEQSRVIAASPRAVFDVAEDVSRLAAWLPTTTSAEATSPDTVHVEGHTHGHGYSSDGFWRPRPEQLRIEWGTPSHLAKASGYAGWLQVADYGDGQAEVTAHLSFLDEEHEAEAGRAPDANLGAALEALDSQVTGSH